MSLDERERTLAEVLRFERSLVLRAGAGSGKTETLTTLALHLLLGLTAGGRRVPPDRLVALTFTEKAAGEMRSRLGRGLRELGAVLEAGRAAAPPATTSFAVLRLLRSARERGAELPDADGLAALERDLDRARVTTIHAFAASVLRAHALEAGVAPGFTVLEEAAARRLARAAVGRAVAAGIRSSAGARELADATRRLWATRRPGAPGLGDQLLDVLLALPETNLAPAELLRRSGYGAERCDAALEAAARPLGLRATAAADGAVLPGLDVLATAHSKAAEVARRLDKAGACREVAREWRGRRRLTERERLVGATAGLQAALPRALRDAGWLVALREHALVAAQLPLARRHAEAFVALLEDARARYDDARREQNALDFGELLTRTLALLRDRADVRRAESSRHDALLVDEVQDTSPVQRELLRLLHGDPDRPGGLRPGGLLLVGDRKQSIYGFRGADVGVLDELTRDVVASGGLELPLRECFRSVPSLVATTNALAAAALVAAEPGAPAPFEVVFEPELDALVGVRDEADGAGATAELLLDDGPTASSAELRRREADAVARRIRQLVEDGAARFGEVALLLPRMTHVARYTDALAEAGVPYVVEGGRGLLETEESRDLLALADVVAGARAPVARAAVLRGPFVALSDPTLVRLVTARGELPSLSELADLATDATVVATAGERRRLARFCAAALRAAAHLDRLGLGAALRSVVDATAYDAVLAALPDAPGRLANLDLLLRSADGDQGDPRAWARRQRERIAAGEAEREAALATDDMDVVHVMTIHQAKGREHPVVVVADCGRSHVERPATVTFEPELGLAVRVPTGDGVRCVDAHGARALARLGQREAAERARLLYVAATRARERLVFAGEAPRRSASSWRAVLDRLAPERLVRVPYSALPEPGSAASGRGAGVGSDGPTAPRLRVHPLAPPELRATVTALGDFADCPRRYRALHVLGLAEPAALGGPGGAARLDDERADDVPSGRGGDARAAGLRLHALLEHLPLAPLASAHEDPELRRADARALLGDTARRLGHDPASPEAGAAIERALPFVLSGYARALAARASEVHCELPFVLRLEGAPSLELRGRIDLVAPDGDDGVAVLDHKASSARPVEHHRFQLDVYRLALAEALDRPLSAVRAGVILHDRPPPEPRWLAAAATSREALRARLGELARAVTDAHASGVFTGREPAFCASIGCAFVACCHPAARDGEGGPESRSASTPRPADRGTGPATARG